MVGPGGRASPVRIVALIRPCPVVLIISQASYEPRGTSSRPSTSAPCSTKGDIRSHLSRARPGPYEARQSSSSGTAATTTK
eukprot:381661-Lingulodinium_polyedra.AAC.1